MYRIMILVAISLSCLGMTTTEAIAQIWNPGFELANITIAPPGYVSRSQALSGWHIGANGTTYPDSTLVLYDDMTLDGAAVSIHDGLGGYGPDPLHGKYSVLFQTPSDSAYWGDPNIPLPYTIYISQVCFVPEEAKSIWLIADNYYNPQPTSNHLFVSLNGINIPMQKRSGLSYAGDISAFAGQESVELRLGLSSSWPQNGPIGLEIDDAMFSETIVPEPSTVVLLCTAMIGFLGFGVRRFIAAFSAR
jgi:hypothetical protein